MGVRGRLEHPLAFAHERDVTDLVVARLEVDRNETVIAEHAELVKEPGRELLFVLLGVDGIREVPR